MKTTAQSTLLTNLTEVYMDLNSPTISQHTYLSKGSTYHPGETFIGNAGFFSAETCNKIAYENSQSSATSTAGMKKLTL
jgi:hypothetical protein